jgi:hypothetical protein
MQPAANRADGHLQDLGHLLVFLSFHVFQDQNGSMFRGEPIQGGLDAPFLFDPFQAASWIRRLGRIGRVKSVFAPTPGVNAKNKALLALEADRRVNGNAVQPRKKQRVALEAVQRQVSIQKGVLNDIVGVFRVADQPENRVVSAVLIAAHQLAKGRRIAFEACGYQPVVVGIHKLVTVLWTPRARREFPKDWLNNGILTPIKRLIYDAIDTGQCQKCLEPPHGLEPNRCLGEAWTLEWNLLK